MKLHVKKLPALFLAVLLAAALPLAALAAGSWEGDDFSMTVPEEFVYSFDSSVSPDDPSWTMAGVADPESRLKDYQDRSVVADFYTEGKTAHMEVIVQTGNEVAQNLYNLKDLTEEERKTFLDQQVQSQSSDLTVAKEYVDVNGQPFFRVQLDMVSEDQEVHELLYGTIFNGHTLQFDMHSDQELTGEQTALLAAAVNSVTITKVEERPAVEVKDILPSLLMLGAMLLVIIVPLVYLPIRGRRDKKVKARMAARLSEYHKTHGSDTVEGQAKFVNVTDCTREALHTFSLYQAYVKNIGSLLAGGIMSVTVLAAAFWIDAEWWAKLLGIAIVVYYAYKVVSMPGTIEKVQKRVLDRGTSTTARYSFYEDAFRVSGIQSASVFPYFQITDVRRNGNYLYLYYGPDNAYLVDKFGFSLGEFEEFVKFIREKTAKEK